MKLGPFKMIVIPPASDQSAETFLLEAHVFKPKGRYSKSQPIINNKNMKMIWHWSRGAQVGDMKATWPSISSSSS